MQRKKVKKVVVYVTTQVNGARRNMLRQRGKLQKYQIFCSEMYVKYSEESNL